MTTADVHLITAEVAVLKSQMDDVKKDVGELKGDVRTLRDEFTAFKGSMRVVLYLTGTALTFLVGVGVAVVVRWIAGG